MASAPAAWKARAISTASGPLMPPGTQSAAEMRTVMGLPLAGSTPSSRDCATSSRLTELSMCSTRSMNGFQNFSSSGTHSSSPLATESKESSIFAVKS